MPMRFRAAIFAGLAAVGMATPALAQAYYSYGASQAGGNFLDVLQGLLTGQLGMFIGLFMVVLGLFTGIMRKEWGAAIVMIIGGALITVSPGVFNGVRQAVGGVVSGISGGSVTQVQPYNGY